VIGIPHGAGARNVGRPVEAVLGILCGHDLPVTCPYPYRHFRPSWPAEAITAIFVRRVSFDASHGLRPCDADQSTRPGHNFHLRASHVMPALRVRRRLPLRLIEAGRHAAQAPRRLQAGSARLGRQDAAGGGLEALLPLVPRPPARGAGACATGGGGGLDRLPDHPVASRAAAAYLPARLSFGRHWGVAKR
jgi:hypothetical protein